MAIPRKCATDACTAERGRKSEYCVNCRKGLRYWEVRTPAAVLERRRRLEVWDGRLDIVQAARKPKAVARGR